MKLTAALWKKLPKGHIFKGKHRLVKPVTGLDIAAKLRDFEREEQNMFYLRHPYLTKEESYCHSKEQGRFEKWIRKWKLIQADKFSQHKPMSDHLMHLRSSDGWESY
ncbi:ribosomal protein 63, mitochondrial [Daktulosphaira vitifoliae]|uniref:ribosomal protein 63, mitochondrial n=1 Tax=Daktulosphaira vitifoliae TaxID=58002 RepID=UPI0021AAD303|nr:ribosomal protein 63, mitochondrial [Daktulosphaira vitifoliae]